MATLPANTDLAVQAWLAAIPSFNAGMVGRELPENPESNTGLVASGFLTALTVGGSPEIYVPRRSPVIQIDSWAFASSTSRRPEWARANKLAEQLVAACYNRTALETTLPLNKTGYGSVRVLSAYPLQEPRPIYGERSYRARFHMDLQVHWIEVLP